VRKKILLLLILTSFFHYSGICQERDNHGSGFLFHGIVMDANTLLPLPNTQIIINNSLSEVSSSDGTFGLYVLRYDTVIFGHLGYKQVFWIVGDTLTGREFAAGIYMRTDTVSIGEVIIVPRYNNLKSQILNSPSKIPSTMENARYNVAISAYQGKTTTGTLGDPESNYNLLHKRQSIAAYEKGGIPSDAIAGFSPLILIPAAYMLLHGLPEKPSSFQKKLTTEEMEQIKELYKKVLAPLPR
jgi:hypothetical protein